MHVAVYAGRCLCGAVTFKAKGEPKRIGICHCKLCKRDTGATGRVFVVYGAEKVAIAGQTEVYAASDKGRRAHCSVCGSPVFSQDVGSDELELFWGLFEERGDGWRPGYEIWTSRRAAWLPPIDGAQQFERGRTV
ncbi:MAG TPA: GFA family protein [Alphaproteobacteria bacterium]|nr:GFA family protein [Alphaproteobacteria bacterium]